MKAETTNAVELGANLLTIGATICFSLSVLYDWGYLFAFGLPLMQAPTTVSDHVRSAVIWLPETILLIVLWLMVAPWPEFAVPRRVHVERDATEGAVRVVPRISPTIISITFAIGLWAVWILLGDNWASGFVIAVIATWVVLFVQLRSHPALGEIISPAAWRVVLYLPIVFALVFSFGYLDAYALVRGKFVPAKVYLKEMSGKQPSELQILRQFEKFTLAREKNGVLVMLQADNMLRVDAMARPREYSGLLCKYFGRPCPR